MKNIIADSLWAHMFLFATMVVVSLHLIKTNPLYFVITGVIYFLLVMRSAMTIADFEMRFTGEVSSYIDKHEGKIDSIDINWRK